MDSHAGLAEEFEAERARLLAIATRVVGHRADAEDVVQEAWLRLQRQEVGSVDDLPAWLTTVVGRLGIDLLRSRTAKGEVLLDGGGPDPRVTPDEGDGPEELAVQGESLGLAVLVVLGSLRPDERLAFVLHDMFAVPFAQIGPIIGKSSDAAKMVASRARRKVHDARPPETSLGEQRRVVDAFLAAAREGDFAALLEILDPDLTWERRSARGVLITSGREEVARAAVRGSELGFGASRVLVDGQVGILGWDRAGRPAGLMICTVERGRMTRIVSILDRDVLARIDVPSPPRG